MNDMFRHADTLVRRFFFLEANSMVTSVHPKAGMVEYPETESSGERRERKREREREREREGGGEGERETQAHHGVIEKGEILSTKCLGCCRESSKRSLLQSISNQSS